MIGVPSGLKPTRVSPSSCPEKAQIDLARSGAGVGLGFGPPVISPAKTEPPTPTIADAQSAAPTSFFSMVTSHCVVTAGGPPADVRAEPYISLNVRVNVADTACSTQIACVSFG